MTAREDTDMALRMLVVLVTFSTVGSTTVLAQLQAGRILGTIFDPQHAGIPGATVVVTNLATNIARSVVTDSEGKYVVTPLHPGTYRVAAEVPGFQKTMRDGLVLTVGQAARVAFAEPAPFTYGNSGRNILRADHQWNVDASMFKRFNVTAASTLEFRAEAFNLLNSVYFNAPNTAIDTAAGGRVTSTSNTARQLQFGLKYTF